MLKTKNLNTHFAVFDSPVYTIAVSPNGRHLAIGLANGFIELWDLRGYPITKSSTSHESFVHCVAFSPNGEIIASSSEDGTIRLWDLKGNTLVSLLGDSGSVYSVAFHPHREIIASGHQDGTIRLWDFQGNAISTFSGHEAAISSIAFDHEGERIASGSFDNTVRLWDLEGIRISTYQRHEAAITSVAFSPHGEMIVSSSLDQTVQLWDLEGNPIIQTFTGNEHAAMSVTFSQDGKIIASSSTNKNIQLFNLEGIPISEPLTGHSDVVTSVAFICNGEIIVSGSLDQTVRLWDLKTGEELTKIPPKISFIGQSPKNDLAEGEDKLNIKNEVYALAEVLMLRDLEPPLAVGILGGWGSGKSYALNLIQRRINEIRSLDLTPIQAWGNPEDFQPNQLNHYAGHIYQIRFDAWTYAKTDLWASLMQTIFYEFNRQITLERQLATAGWDLLQGGAVWQALNEMNDEEREELLSRELQDKFEIWKAQTSSHETANLLWETLTELRESEKQVLSNIESELNQKRVELENLKIEAAKKAKNELAQSLDHWQPIKDKLINIFGESLQKFLEEIRNSNQPEISDKLKKEDIELIEFALQEFKPTIWDSFKQLWQDRKKNKLTIIIFLVGVLLTLTTPFLLIKLGTFFQSLGTILAFVFALIPSSANLLKKLQKTNELLKTQISYYQKIVQDEKQRSENLYEQLIQKNLQQIGVNEQEAEIKKLEIQAENQRQKIGLTANYTSLVDFVDARLEKNIYGKRLGLLQQVQRDLMDLTAHFTFPKEYWRYRFTAKVENLQKIFPRGQARIVLYIDDLDRCPPQRVVEVLEAVQLLLKTPLFIVILAIDDRYIARALEDVYKGVLKRKGNPSGIDYLEKIIQIPYRMRPISYLNLSTYLESQIEIEDESSNLESQTPVEQTTFYPSQSIAQQTTSNISISQTIAAFSQFYDYQIPQTLELESLQHLDHQLEDELETVSEVTKFSATEFKMLENCCKHVDLSPRTTKRLINIYKILKIIWSRYESIGKVEPEQPVKRSVMAFLALSGRYPHLMRGLFEEIDMYFEQTEVEQQIYLQNLELDKLLNDLKKQISSHDYYYQREWKKFNHDVRNMLQEVLQDGNITLNKEIFSLMLSFCFIGDIGYDPDDFRLDFSTNGKQEKESYFNFKDDTA